MIDWEKPWDEPQLIEIDSEWVEKVRSYDFKADTAISMLLQERHLMGEMHPLVYKGSDYGPARYATVMLQYAVVIILDIKNDMVEIQFRSEEAFAQAKKISKLNPDRVLIMIPRCFVNVRDKTIRRFVTFDLKWALK